MPTPEEIEAAELFLAKAASDLAAARSLAADADQADDVVGFHAQQAVEKALKAVVAVRSLEIPRSHDIGLLLRLLAGTELPEDIAEADWLNPWAVTMRYDQAGGELGRPRAVHAAQKALDWAQDRVQVARAESRPQPTQGTDPRERGAETSSNRAIDPFEHFSNTTPGTDG